MPLIFRRIGRSRSVNFCGSALAILGFADVGRQRGGAAAFPDSFNAGS